MNEMLSVTFACDHLTFLFYYIFTAFQVFGQNFDPDYLLLVI